MEADPPTRVASAAAASPKPRPGATVDDDVRRVVARHGADAVKAAVKRLSKQRPGRKATSDWPGLIDVLEADARRLLEGGDPFTERSNYSISQAFAAAHPGHSSVSTQRRLMNKLAKKRAIYTHILAIFTGWYECSSAIYIKTLLALIEIDDNEMWVDRHDAACRQLGEYIVIFGEPPESMSMREIIGRATGTMPKSPFELRERSRGGLLGGFAGSSDRG
ncbi:hypothetical protein [Sphingomonas solaris]|uniref:Uncharacterized protein n=1 Tax=Alterirhizorhabdus solaris TaxID=2529389 RepID=A0A558R9H0_9SPHN|nr:hypothetical protein [Sphingomonas solaris]TVV76027.1 hypothetical protein FOY91_05455 [Sphingomonas solaris]